MFHYAFLVAWEPFWGRPKLQNDAFHSQTDARPEANPILIHSVHKLFTDRCTSKRNEILPSRTPSAISFIRWQSEAGKFDGLYPETAAKKIKVGPGPLALPPFIPACHQDRASHLGLGRNWSWLGSRDETQGGLGGGQPRRNRDVVRPIPRLRLTVKAKASQSSTISAGTTSAAEERR